MADEQNKQSVRIEQFKEKLDRLVNTDNVPPFHPLEDLRSVWNEYKKVREIQRSSAGTDRAKNAFLLNLRRP
jgi:hypothetical protein